VAPRSVTFSPCQIALTVSAQMLELVAAEDPDLLHALGERVCQEGMTKRASATSE
jgi:hypothetical protein